METETLILDRDEEVLIDPVVSVPEVLEPIYRALENDDSSNEISNSNAGLENKVITEEEKENIQEIVLKNFQGQRAIAREAVADIIKKSTVYSKFICDRMKSEIESASLVPKEGKSAFEDASVGDERILMDERQPKLFTGSVLHPYQIDGFIWLKTLYENGVNGILADEMGLGKTAQSIAMIAHLIEEGINGPFLVSGPLTTILNWCLEFQRFTPKIPVVLYYGNISERKSILKNKLIPSNGVLPVFVTSYNYMMNDQQALKLINWKYLVIDEGHRLKNNKCKFFSVLKQYSYENLLLLTGTPLQNNLSELWSILNIALPEIFSNLSQFEALMDISAISTSISDELIASEEQKDNLISNIHQLLAPYILRRTKVDVNLELPPKKEIVVYAAMTPLQHKYYSAILDGSIECLLMGKDRAVPLTKSKLRKRKRNINYKVFSDYSFSFDADDYNDGSNSDESTKNSSNESVVHITSNVQMMLRQVCLHPYLVCYPLDPQTRDIRIDDDLVSSAGKLLLLDTILPELQRRGHKVLIFSQMVMMLHILVDYCSLRNYKFCQIHGGIKLEERMKEMNKFNEDPSYFLFLLSTKAACLGVNLTAADTVIIYDSDWNPQNDLQAQDRCHRIGQTKPVIIYRFITQNTIEDTMLTRVISKRKLEKLILKKGRFSTGDTLAENQAKLKKEDILELLKSCNVINSVSSEEVISARNLDLLLDRTDIASTCSEKSVDNVFMILK